MRAATATARQRPPAVVLPLQRRAQTAQPAHPLLALLLARKACRCWCTGRHDPPHHGANRFARWACVRGTKISAPGELALFIPRRPPPALASACWTCAVCGPATRPQPGQTAEPCDGASGDAGGATTHPNTRRHRAGPSLGRIGTHRAADARHRRRGGGRPAPPTRLDDSSTAAAHRVARRPRGTVTEMPVPTLPADTSPHPVSWRAAGIRRPYGQQVEGAASVTRRAWNTSKRTRGRRHARPRHPGRRRPLAIRAADAESHPGHLRRDRAAGRRSGRRGACCLNAALGARGTSRQAAAAAASPPAFIETDGRRALKGERVVRLGRRPRVFGRGEEAEHLREQGIEVDGSAHHRRHGGNHLRWACRSPRTARARRDAGDRPRARRRGALHWPTLAAAAAQGLTLVVHGRRRRAGTAAGPA